MCGEYIEVEHTVHAVLGSPPHVRGIQRLSRPVLLNAGITPACAGNTREAVHNLAGRKDHPRMCGEYTRRHHELVIRRGSPPHVRGIQAYQSMVVRLLRITPACAGNT